MWHEARKQEKKIRSLMVDYKRRADRRREFYEKIKLDPAQFLRVYGRPTKIHWEHSVAIAAESPQSMMPWQGDNTIQIDRFDVRAHLDYIPDYMKAKHQESDSDEDEEESQCNYERYKILVQNHCAGVSEEQCLQQIYADEMFGSQAEQTRLKEKEDEKKKLAVKKAAIGYSYDDNNAQGKGGDEKESKNNGKAAAGKGDESDEECSDVDLDAVFDVDKITNEQTAALNVCGHEYGMAEDDFFECLWKDKEEAEEIRMAKVMEEEKAQFSAASRDASGGRTKKRSWRNVVSSVHPVTRHAPVPATRILSATSRHPDRGRAVPSVESRRASSRVSEVAMTRRL